MQKELQFFEQNKNIIESLRNENEIIEFFTANNFFVDKNFLNRLKIKYNISNNSTKLNNSQLEKVAGGLKSVFERFPINLHRWAVTTRNLHRRAVTTRNLHRWAVTTRTGQSLLNGGRVLITVVRDNSIYSTDRRDAPLQEFTSPQIHHRQTQHMDPNRLEELRNSSRDLSRNLESAGKRPRNNRSPKWDSPSVYSDIAGRTRRHLVFKGVNMQHIINTASQP